MKKVFTAHCHLWKSRTNICLNKRLNKGHTQRATTVYVRYIKYPCYIKEALRSEARLSRREYKCTAAARNARCL